MYVHDPTGTGTGTEGSPAGSPEASCAENEMSRNEVSKDEVVEQVLAVLGGVFDCKNLDVGNLFEAAITEVRTIIEL